MLSPKPVIVREKLEREEMNPILRSDQIHRSVSLKNLNSFWEKSNTVEERRKRNNAVIVDTFFHDSARKRLRPIMNKLFSQFKLSSCLPL
jgi:hypothetical protein